ncbi:hypothetical protein [Pseudomonas guariconensis]|uniref:hypothetical protein n=1 Tax=Pseudomonas guariconensis TaxID=1288410 RepID=UPI0039064EB6
MVSEKQANLSDGELGDARPKLRSVLSFILNALDSDAKDGKAARGELAAALRAALAALPNGALADNLNSINHELADLNPANPGEVERLRLAIEQLRFSLEAHDYEAVQDDCVRIENRTLRAQLAELVSAVRSINFGPAHAIQVRGDDEPCYPQRKEWIEWLLGLCDAASESSGAADTYRLLTKADMVEPTDELLEDNATTWALHGPGPFAGKPYCPSYMVPMRRRVIQEVQS